MSRRRNIMKDNTAALAVVRELTSPARRTCEGCALLRTYPRPMCAGEKSPHFRTVRDTYHERCQWYEIGGRTAPTQASPPPPKAHIPVAVHGRRVRR